MFVFTFQTEEKLGNLDELEQQLREKALRSLQEAKLAAHVTQKDKLSD